jgi:hypothetical protein
MEKQEREDFVKHTLEELEQEPFEKVSFENYDGYWMVEGEKKTLRDFKRQFHCKEALYDPEDWDKSYMTRTELKEKY